VAEPRLPAGVTGAPLALLGDSDYLPALHALLANARGRIDASLFLIDVRPGHGGATAADDVLEALAAAAWRGVAVRLLIGGSRTNLSILESCTAAAARARSLGVPVRLLATRAVRGSHAKFVIADDHVLLGSQNWSHGAFFEQMQDAVCLRSAALAAQLGTLFARQWARAATPRRRPDAGAGGTG
jgi:phosphatidylserine/phosphatidylglycerophosphate/cardiolipin synthase-like enzyme